jgi:hypothetical protein
MEEEEWNELQDCADCGASLDPRADRAYLISDQLCLCFSCAVRRGGRYDALHETWSAAPDVSDRRRDSELLG